MPAPQAPQADWATAYAQALGVQPRLIPHAAAFLRQWQPWEGGATHNSATNNYLNTEEPMPGSRSMGGGSAVQAYASLQDGAAAFAKTLLGNPNYAPLVQYLRTGQGDPSPGLQEWVSGRTNGNPGYAAKILGSHLAGQTLAGAAADAGAQHLTQLPGEPSLGTPDGPTLEETIQQQAQKNLASIASGAGTPTDELSSLATAVQHFKSVVPTVQQTPQAVADPTSVDAQAVKLAQKYLGVKYTWGGTSASTGFDCSGLVQTVWKQMGVNVGRTTYQQFQEGQPVAQQDLRPGDAVFFTGSDPQGGLPGHEGMYIGDGKFIEAPGTGMTVRISNLAGRSDYVGARRFA